MKRELKRTLDNDMLNEMDREAISSIEIQLDDSERLIWAARPKYYFSLTSLEIGGYDVALGPTNLYFIALLINLNYSYEYYSSGNYFKSALLFLLGFTLFLLPDIIEEIRRRNTAYAATNKHLFFKLWGIRKSKRRVEKIKLSEIGDIRYEEYKDKSGILHFFFKTQPAFKTYDFSAGGMRHHPTFENIKEVISVYHLLLKTRDKGTLSLKKPIKHSSPSKM